MKYISSPLRDHRIQITEKQRFVKKNPLAKRVLASKRIRTSGLRIRSPSLYPTELWTHMFAFRVSEMSQLQLTGISPDNRKEKLLLA